MSHTAGDTSSLRKFLKNRSVFLGIVIIVISVAASFSFRAFATVLNVKSIILNMSTYAIVAIGMMLLLISGVFDLSVGSVFGFSGAVAGSLMYYYGVNTWVAVFVALLGCLGIGAFNGTLIARVGVNPLIVTLGMMGLVRGLDYLVAGTGIFELPRAFFKIADNTILGLRIPIWYMVVIAVVFSFLVSKTIFFRKYYYIGVNQRAAALTGINVVKMRIFSFMITSGLAGIAGIIMTSRLEIAMSTLGVGLEFRVITACILGGASLSGGKGSVLDAILGTLFMAIVSNLMIVAKIHVYWQNIVTGLIFLIAVTIDAILNKRVS
jgi:ribose transport system permease protein